MFTHNDKFIKTHDNVHIPIKCIAGIGPVEGIVSPDSEGKWWMKISNAKRGNIICKYQTEEEAIAEHDKLLELIANL